MGGVAYIKRLNESIPIYCIHSHMGFYSKVKLLVCDMNCSNVI